MLPFRSALYHFATLSLLKKVAFAVHVSVYMGLRVLWSAYGGVRGVHTEVGGQLARVSSLPPPLVPVFSSGCHWARAASVNLLSHLDSLSSLS